MKLIYRKRLQPFLLSVAKIVTKLIIQLIAADEINFVCNYSVPLFNSFYGFISSGTNRAKV